MWVDVQLWSTQCEGGGWMCSSGALSVGGGGEGRAVGVGGLMCSSGALSVGWVV